MAMLQLQPDQIAVFWDSIKHTMLRSNIVSETNKDVYLNNVLEKCLAGKLACWVVFDIIDGQKQIYTVVMTSINEDRLFGYRYVVVEGIFGFRKLSDPLMQEMINGLKTYAKNVDCLSVKAIVNDAKAARVCALCGAANVGNVYSLEV